MASVHPGRVRQLLAYQTFVIREGRRLGGNGWRLYDTMFRQQAALDPTVDWSKINSTLYAVSFVTQQGSRVRSCWLAMLGARPQRGGMLTASGGSLAKTEGSQLPGKAEVCMLCLE